MYSIDMRLLIHRYELKVMLYVLNLACYHDLSSDTEQVIDKNYWSNYK